MRNNKGNATIIAVSVCMSLILVMCVIFEYMQMLIICNGIKSAVQSAVISTVVANYDDSYSQLREGYSGGYTYVDTDFTETIDTWNVYTRLDELLGLQEDGDNHIKYIGTEKEYSITNMRIETENTDFAQGNALKNLNATVYLDVEIPVRLSGRVLLPLKVTMKVKASYVPKF